MKRQNIRKMLILIGFVVFPLVLYYLSPALIIMATFEGLVSGSFVVFAGMFISSLFFGRAYCAWVCPAGGLQECCTMVSDKRAPGGRFNWIKYGIWVPWMGIIIAGAVSVGGYRAVNVFYQLDEPVDGRFLMHYLVMYYIVVSIMALLSFTSGRRAFCHYACWMAPFMIIGARIKNVLGYPSLKLQADTGKCIGCMQCSKKCPMSLDVEVMVKSGNMNDDECILCGECADGCPKKAIRYGIK